MDSYIYLDTNIVSDLAKNRDWWNKFHSFINREGLTLGISGAQLVELSDAVWLHIDLADLLWHVPAKVIINWDEIVERRIRQKNLFDKVDVAFYPYILSDSPEKDAKGRFQAGLAGLKMKEARRIQLNDAAKLRNTILERMSNFPSDKNGKYKPNQARKYARSITTQWLKTSDPALNKLYKKYGNLVDHFRAIEIFAYFSFYKYYIAGHAGKNVSDFGDLFHLFYLPFVSIAILERGMVEILKQIQKNHEVVGNTLIENISFAREKILKLGRD